MSSLTSPTQASRARLIFLSSTMSGDGEMYYSALQDVGAPPGEREAIVVTRLATEARLANFLPQQLLNRDFGAVKTLVARERIKCEERKISALKMEFYDASNQLIYLAWLQWTDFLELSPMGVLQRILCTPQQVQK